MKMNYIVFFFVCIQFALSFSNAKLTNESKCTNGFLTQWANDHYECKCNEGFGLTSETECKEVKECNDTSVEHDVCGDYRTCEIKNQVSELTKQEVQTKDTVESIGDSADTKNLQCQCSVTNYVDDGKGNCVPQPCKTNNVNCQNGKCILLDDTTSTTCVCNANWDLDMQKPNCNVPKNSTCSLNCESTEECDLIDGAYFKCVPKKETNSSSNSTIILVAIIGGIAVVVVIGIIVVCMVF